MTKEEFKAWIEPLWGALPPSGTDFADFTEDELSALNAILEKMEPSSKG